MIKRERTIDSIGDRSPYVAELPLQLQREKGNESSSTWKRWSIHYHRKESDAIGTPLYALIKEVRTSTNLPIWPYGRSHLLLKNGMIFYCRVSKHVWKPVYPFEMCNMKITRQMNRVTFFWTKDLVIVTRKCCDLTDFWRSSHKHFIICFVSLWEPYPKLAWTPSSPQKETDQGNPKAKCYCCYH